MSDSEHSSSPLTAQPWLVTEIKFSGTAGAVDNALPYLLEDHEFLKWAEGLRNNDRSTAKAFIKETDLGVFSLRIKSHFVDSSRNILHVHLAVGIGAIVLEDWTDKQNGKSEI